MYEIIIFIAGIVMDRLSKLWISSNFVGKSTHIIDGVLDFTYTENTGAAFSILSDSTLLLAIFSAVMCAVLIFVLFYYRKNLAPLSRFALSMIISGAISNCLDRFIYGYVVDFIELTFVNFAIFNIADIFITMGSIFLAMSILFNEINTKKEKKDGEKADS